MLSREGFSVEPLLLAILLLVVYIPLGWCSRSRAPSHLVAHFLRMCSYRFHERGEEFPQDLGYTTGKPIPIYPSPHMLYYHAIYVELYVREPSESSSLKVTVSLVDQVDDREIACDRRWTPRTSNDLSRGSRRIWIIRFGDNEIRHSLEMHILQRKSSRLKIYTSCW